MPFVSIADIRRELVPGSAIVLGRDRGVDLPVRDPHVSRRHARLEALDQDRLLVADLDSANGILVDGRKVPWALLAPGDVFTAGLTSVHVEA